MADLSDFKSDTRAINDGIWLRVNESLYGDLEILSRGFTDDFVDSQNARMTKAAEEWGGDRTRIPNAVSRAINATLLQDFLVLDVRNLKSDGQDVTVAQFHELLEDPAYNRLSRACWDAAGKVTVQSAKQLEKALGNSPAPSPTTLNGAGSAPA